MKQCALFTQMFSSLSLVRVGSQQAGGVLGEYSMSGERVIKELEAGVGIGHFLPNFVAKSEQFPALLQVNLSLLGLTGLNSLTEGFTEDGWPIQHSVPTRV